MPSTHSLLVRFNGAFATTSGSLLKIFSVLVKLKYFPCIRRCSIHMAEAKRKSAFIFIKHYITIWIFSIFFIFSRLGRSKKFCHRVFTSEFRSICSCLPNATFYSASSARYRIVGPDAHIWYFLFAVLFFSKRKHGKRLQQQTTTAHKFKCNFLRMHFSWWPYISSAETEQKETRKTRRIKME